MDQSTERHSVIPARREVGYLHVLPTHTHTHTLLVEEEEKFISSRQVQYKHTKSIQTPNIYNCLPEAASEQITTNTKSL